MTPHCHHATTTSNRARRRAFTLVEMMVSLSIMSVLMLAMTSIVLLASHALPDGNSPLETSVHAADVVDAVAEDIVYATQVTAATATGISVTVADRGHGAAGPESIRIAWSGTPGDPLTRRYNGGTIVNICDKVQSFSLDYFTEPGSLPTSHNLLFVTNNAVSPSADDLAKIAKFESWGYTVQAIADSDTVDAFNIAVKTADVMYISEYVTATNLNTKPIDGSIGVVAEERYVGPTLGISTASGTNMASTVDVIDNTHMITSGLSLGALTVCTSSQCLGRSTGTLSPGAFVLAELSAQPSLIAMEIGAERYDGGTADGRRVMLPWGGFAIIHYDFSALNTTALRMVKRSLAWASVPAVYSTVRIKLQTGTVAAGAIETSVQLLNKPEAR